MGLRGELFSTRVMLPNRTYFFNVKENRMGDLYLNIVESKNRETGDFDRQSVILFADDLQEFLKGFDESLRVLEKEMRERRRLARADTREARGRSGGSERGEKHGGHRSANDKKAGPADRPRKRHPKEGKRIIVKKRHED